jgi:hypothetical protein
VQTREGQIEKLSAELREKSVILARQERTVWQDIERRSTWKRRLSKIGIPMKEE